MIKNKSLLVIVIILIALGVIYTLQQKADKQSVRTADQGFVNLSADFDVSGIAQVRAWAGEGPTTGVIVLKKAGESWIAPEQFDAPVDQTKVDKLFQDLSGLQGSLRSESASVLADYEISDTQALHVELFDESGKEKAHLLFGKAGQQYNTGFARRAGENSVYGIASNPRMNFNIYSSGSAPELKTWLNLKLLTFDANTIQRLEINDYARRLVFEKQTTAAAAETQEGADAPPAPDPAQPAESEWVLIEPEGYSVAESKFTSFLNQLKNVRAENIVDPAKLEEYGLAEPQRSVVIGMGGDQTVSVLLGKQAPPDSGSPGSGTQYVMIGGQPHVYTLRDYSVSSSLMKRAADLLDLPAIGIDKEKATEIIVNRGEDRIQLKKEEAWTAVNPEAKGELQTSRVDSLLGALGKVALDDIITDSAFSAPTADNNQGRLKVNLDGGESFEMYVGDALPGDGIQRAVRFADREGIYVLKQSTLDTLMPAVGDLLTLSAITLTTDEVKGIQLEAADGARRIFTLVDGQWSCSAPEETFEADSGELSSFMDTLAALQPKTLLGPVSGETSGLNKIIISDGTKTETIQFGDKGKDAPLEIIIDDSRRMDIRSDQMNRLHMSFDALFALKAAAPETEAEEQTTTVTASQDSGEEAAAAPVN